MRPAPTLDGPTKPPVISQSGRGRAGVQTCRVLSVECECERARAWGGEILCTPSASVYPKNMVRTVRAGPRRRSSPELAGRPPAGGGSGPNRGGREDSPPMALAGLHFFPQIWSEPSEKGPRRKSSPELAGPPPASGG